MDCRGSVSEGLLLIDMVAQATSNRENGFAERFEFVRESHQTALGQCAEIPPVIKHASVQRVSFHHEEPTIGNGCGSNSTACHNAGNERPEIVLHALNL